jgi:DNA repair protein RecN (Recombination protein N)
MAELKAHADTLRGELETLRGAGERLIVLGRERVRIGAEYEAVAQDLTRLRTGTARRLSADVSALMGELGMAGGMFEATLEKVEKSTPDAQGQERTEFLVSANPGQPPKSLAKVASGGELSRISLAIQVAAAVKNSALCMVFDEVDAGIGGAVAEIVGRQLRDLGARAQVLCVTHLAQVAAQAHSQFRVIKMSLGATTRTSVELLGPAQRVDEIARMLGGVDITDQARAHAGEMLARAQTSEPQKKKRSRG